MKTKASILRRKAHLKALQETTTPASPKPARDDFVLAHVIGIAPNKLPDPWHYDSQCLLRDVDRIRELALRIPPIRNDKRQLKARRRRKRKLYSLSSNREADLYIPRHFTLIARPLNQSGPRAKIIPFAHKQS